MLPTGHEASLDCLKGSISRSLPSYPGHSSGPSSGTPSPVSHNGQQPRPRRPSLRAVGLPSLPSTQDAVLDHIVARVHPGQPRREIGHRCQMRRNPPLEAACGVHRYCGIAVRARRHVRHTLSTPARPDQVGSRHRNAVKIEGAGAPALVAAAAEATILASVHSRYGVDP